MPTPSFFIARMASTICSTIFGDSPSEGSSSSTSEGLPISVRAIVSICCSPPLMGNPSLVLLDEIRKQREHLFARPVWRVRPLRLLADFEVLLDREIGKDPPLFWHIAEPAAHDRMRRLGR